MGTQEPEPGEPAAESGAAAGQASVQGTAPGAALERLVEVIAQLREHCPWTAALTHASLVEYILEESYELLEVIEGEKAPATDGEPTNDSPERFETALRGELGDVLLQAVLHSRLAQERGSFGLAEVIGALTDKLVRRSPHVFGPDGALRSSFPATVAEVEAAWREIKRAEEPGRTGMFDGIPRNLPALALASETVGRLRAAGQADRLGETPGVDPEPEYAPWTAPALDPEEHLGEHLLNVVVRAEEQGVDPERALRSAVRRLQAAFTQERRSPWARLFH
jgi:NTP pyrophosphatase (non-canonical NTP hydrolase)